MAIKYRMRVYAPDWNTNFMDNLPRDQRPDTGNEEVKQVVIVCHPATKIIKKQKASVS